MQKRRTVGFCDIFERFGMGVLYEYMMETRAENIGVHMELMSQAASTVLSCMERGNIDENVCIEIYEQSDNGNRCCSIDIAAVLRSRLIFAATHTQSTAFIAQHRANSHFPSRNATKALLTQS